MDQVAEADEVLSEDRSHVPPPWWVPLPWWRTAIAGEATGGTIDETIEATGGTIDGIEAGDRARTA